ncbi:MAG: NuoM family protein [Candidatus Bathyarchaeia archaeon]
MIDNVLLATVIITILPAPIVYLLGKKMGKQVGYVVAAILFCTTIVYGLLMPVVEHESVLEEFVWAFSPVKLSFGFLADGLSIPILFTFLFIFAFAAVYSVPYMERRLQSEDLPEKNNSYAMYFTFYLLYAGSIAGSVLSTNLIEFYLFFECALLFSWVLVLMFGYGDRERISIQYFLYTHLGGASLLLGILAASWMVGSFDIADLSYLGQGSGVFWVGFAIALGLLVKIGGLGLHGWMPDTYSESPAPVSAVLGATSVLLSTYSLSRLMPFFKDVLFGISGWFELWALLTILYAGSMALVQSDTKRLVAYLSMSQMNYCVLGVFTYVEYGVLGAISYSISHGLAIALLFLVAGAVLYRTGTRDMDQLGGLAERLPTAIIASIVGFLTIGGVPPAVGFKSKFILLSGAFVRGLSHSTLEFIIAILAGSLATVITLGYEFNTVWRVFYGKLPDSLKSIKNVPINMAMALIALSALSLIFGIWPALITNPIEVFIHHIFH